MFKCKVLKRQDIIFLLALFCEIVAMLISLTTIPYMVNQDQCNMILKIIRYAGYLLIIIKIYFDEHGRDELLLIGIVIIVTLLVSRRVGNNSILCLTLFIIGMYNIDFKMVTEYMVVWYLCGIIITIAGSQLGLIQNWVYYEGTRERYSLGYLYPSHATSSIFYFVLLFCYMKGNRLRLWHVIVLELLNIVQYICTNSRAGTLLMVLVPIMFYLIRCLNENSIIRLLGWIGRFAFLVCALFSFVLSYFYRDDGIIAKINQIINNRLSLGHNALLEYGFPLFGKKIEWIGNGGIGYIRSQLKGEYNFVDCSYLKIMFDYGLVFLVVFLVGYTMATCRAYKEKDYYLVCALAFMAGYSIIEPRLIEIGFNPFVLVLVALFDVTIYKKRIYKKINGGTYNECKER